MNIPASSLFLCSVKISGEVTRTLQRGSTPKMPRAAPQTANQEKTKPAKQVAALQGRFDIAAGLDAGSLKRLISRIIIDS